MAVEANQCGGDLAVPEADAAIFVSDRKDVAIGLALRKGCDLCLAVFIAPPGQELAFLNIPTYHLLVGSDNGLTCPSRSPVTVGPEDIRRARRDQAERLGVLVFPAGIVSGVVGTGDFPEVTNR